jgi:hypothetical protein
MPMSKGGLCRFAFWLQSLASEVLVPRDDYGVTATIYSLYKSLICFEAFCSSHFSTPELFTNLVARRALEVTGELRQDEGKAIFQDLTFLPLVCRQRWRRRPYNYYFPQLHWLIGTGEILSLVRKKLSAVSSHKGHWGTAWFVADYSWLLRSCLSQKIDFK